MQISLILWMLTGLVAVSVAESQDVQLEPEARQEPAEPEEQPTIQIKEGDGVHQFAVAIPTLQQTHYQSIHDDGKYSFGYSYPDQVHVESRTADGSVSGSYFYTDPQGKQNQVIYQADGAGFRVSSNNVPVFNAEDLPKPVEDTPEVAEAKRQHLAIWRAIAEHHRQLAGQTSGVNPEPVKDSLIVPEPVAVQEPGESIQIKPLDTDIIVDEDKDAIITERLTGSTSDFDPDAEPIKLLAQFYGKHLKNQPQEAEEKIDRPQGFYPAKVNKPYNGYDIFRYYGDESVSLNNPEYVDLPTFALYNLAEAQNVQARSDSAGQDLPAGSEWPKLPDVESRSNRVADVELVQQPLDVDAAPEASEPVVSPAVSPAAADQTGDDVAPAVVPQVSVPQTQVEDEIAQPPKSAEVAQIDAKPTVESSKDEQEDGEDITVTAEEPSSIPIVDLNDPDPINSVSLPDPTRFDENVADTQETHAGSSLTLDDLSQHLSRDQIQKIYDLYLNLYRQPAGYQRPFYANEPGVTHAYASRYYNEYPYANYYAPNYVWAYMPVYPRYLGGYGYF